MTLRSLASVLLPALALLAQPAGDIKTHTETIRSASHTFQIDGGSQIDLGFWYLKDDNRTIASMAELEAHPE